MSYQYLDQKDLNEETLKNEKEFIEDAAIFLENREGYEFDYNKKDVNQDIYDAYMEHFRVQNVNEVTATRDLFYAQTANAEEKQRMGRLMNVFDKMDGELGWGAALDYAEGVFTAPSTYAGIFSFGAAKAGSLAAQQGIKYGIREILKRSAKESLKKQGIKATATNVSKEVAKAGITKKTGAKLKSLGQGFIGGGYKTALGSVGVDAGASAFNIYQQGRTREELNIGDVSFKDMALGATFSALGSGFIGAFTGSSRTVSANVAEQVRISAIKKESNVIEAVHKNLTTKTAKGKNTKATFKQIKRKLSLLDTVPEKLAEGKKLKSPEGLSGDIDFKSGNFVPTIEEKFHENIASAASQIIAKVKPIVKEVKTKKGGKAFAEERITSRLARGLTSGDVKMPELLEILDNHGLSMTHLSSLIVEEYSQAGRLLQKAGAMKKADRAQLLEELAGVDQKLLNLAEIENPAKLALKQGENEGSKIKNLFTNWFNLSAVNKARVGFMTIQTSTTARNTTNGYMRNHLYALDNLGSGLFNLTKGGGLKVAGLTNKALSDEGSRAVAKGMAQMRTGGQSLAMKDLWLGMRSWETEALELLFRDSRFTKSIDSKLLFREMGDIGNLTGQEAGIVGIARKANFLNTMSDNLFKRAIFSREVDQFMRSKGGFKGGLKEFFEDYYLDPITANQKKTQAFKALSESEGGKEALGNAMNKALEFSYQTGGFSNREGGFNKLADWFIKTATEFIPFSAVAPFPKYLVNQLIFQYEHIPLLGLANLGGILNKAGGKKGVRGYDLMGLGKSFGTRVVFDDEAFGKQLGGLATIATFYGIRANFGDESSGPYEFKVMGDTYNLEAALGPFMGAAWAADWLYRHTGPNERSRKVGGVTLPQIHDNDKVAVGISGKSRDGINALLGGSAKGGSGLWIVDSLVDGFVNADQAGSPATEKAQEIVAEFAANFFNSALVPLGLLKDIAGITLEPEYRIIKDTSDVDMMEYMLKKAFRSAPHEFKSEEGDIPVRQPTKNKPLYNVNPFIKMLVGWNQEDKKNIVEKELDRLRFDYREISPTRIKGDKGLSNEAKGYMGIAAEEVLIPYILSDEYRSYKTDKQKRYKLKEKLNFERAQARKRTLLPNATLETPKEMHRKYKAIFRNLPTAQRDMVAEEYYLRTDGGNIYDADTDAGKGDYEQGLTIYMELFSDNLDKNFVPLKEDLSTTIQ
jgi:hypothetical protein